MQMNLSTSCVSFSSPKPTHVAWNHLLQGLHLIQAVLTSGRLFCTSRCIRSHLAHASACISGLILRGFCTSSIGFASILDASVLRSSPPKAGGAGCKAGTTSDFAKLSTAASGWTRSICEVGIPDFNSSPDSSSSGS